MNKYSLVIVKLLFSLGAFLPSFFGIRLAEKLFTTPFTSARRDIEIELLKSAEIFYVSQGENEIMVYRWGEKTDPIVLFVHGWTSTGTCFIKFIKPLIAHGYQVVSYDSIAHGGTHGATSASITQWADAVISVIKNVGKVHCIVGHSLGSGALVIAASLKLETHKLVLISPVTDIIELTEKFAKELNISTRVIKKMQSYAWLKYAHISSKYGKNWQDIFDSNISVSTLIIHDQNDTEVDIDNARKLVKKIRRAKLIETEKLGHRRILLNPNVIKTIIAFMESDKHFMKSN